MKKNNWKSIVIIVIITFCLGFYLGHYFGIKKGASGATKLLIENGIIKKTDK